MNSSGNPLLEKSRVRFEAVPFDRLRTDHFMPAVEAAIANTKAAIKAIKDSTEAPTFLNTVVALSQSSLQVEYVASTFFNLNACDGTDEMQQLAKRIMPLVSALENDINLDPELFARIKAVYEGRANESLDTEDKQLLDKVYRSFVRNGALLDDADKTKLRELDAELSTLSPRFHENVLKATNDYELHLTDQRDLAGLPDSIVEAAASAAKERGKGGYIFTLHAPSVMPFLKYADQEGRRKEIWFAMNSRSYKGKFDNVEVVKRIVELRHQRANLLGFTTHAEFQLQERMAESPDKVKQFLGELLSESKGAAAAELRELEQLKSSLGNAGPIQPWDWHYYSNKLKEKKYSFNEEELRPYFPLEQVVEGVFLHAQKLYGMTFMATDDYPVYHPEVQVYEVNDQDGRFLGLLYTDFFPRATKGQGAWCTRYKDQGVVGSDEQRSHVSIVCNFSKPSEGKPALLNYSEVNTLFHEFGHALHSLLSEVKYCALSGTKVYRDFVELPSQIMENWIEEKESLNLFARHYESGDVIPESLVRKIKESARFQAGLLMLRQLKFALLDMAFHDQDSKAISDLEAFEAEVTKGAELLPLIKGTSISCSFSHIFSGGYSAGYYSYKWAEVLDADAFEEFRTRGIFDRATALKFRTHILERGGSEHPMTLYKKFRGREPDPRALLRRAGLTS